MVRRRLPWGGGPRGNGQGDNPPPESSIKAYEEQKRILWLDAPGGAPASKKTIQAHGYIYKANFEAIVSKPGGKPGDDGFCKCTWNVEIVIDKAGKVTKNDMSDPDCVPK